jgi:KDO2-lipid IV(A) lauroyltransferase
MSMVDGAPPVRWLFAGPKKRARAVRYWIVDSLVGLLNYGVHAGLRALPTDLCSGFGAAMSRFSPGRYKESDARARQLMQRLRPDLASDELEKTMRRLWRCVGRTMAEYSVLHRLWGEGRVTIEGLEHLAAARDNGIGMLIAPVHLGNWEAIPGTLPINGFPGTGFYEPPENRFEHRIAVEVRERCGERLIFPTSVGGREAFRHLTGTESKREVFVIYIDEIFQGRVSAPALGRVQKPEGNIAHIARLARLTGAAVIPAYCVRLNDSANFKVIYLPPVKMTRSNDRNSDLAANIEELNRIFEPIIIRHLDQWFYSLDFEL